jgi:hypothetical protein
MFSFRLYIKTSVMLINFWFLDVLPAQSIVPSDQKLSCCIFSDFFTSQKSFTGMYSIYRTLPLSEKLLSCFFEKDIVVGLKPIYLNIRSSKNCGCGIPQIFVSDLISLYFPHLSRCLRQSLGEEEECRHTFLVWIDVSILNINKENE